MSDAYAGGVRMMLESDSSDVLHNGHHLLSYNSRYIDFSPSEAKRVTEGSGFGGSCLYSNPCLCSYMCEKKPEAYTDTCTKDTKSPVDSSATTPSNKAC